MKTAAALFVKKSERREFNLDVTQPLFKIFFGSDGSENDVSPAISNLVEPILVATLPVSAMEMRLLKLF